MDSYLNLMYVKKFKYWFFHQHILYRHTFIHPFTIHTYTYNIQNRLQNTHMYATMHIFYHPYTSHTLWLVTRLSHWLLLFVVYIWCFCCCCTPPCFHIAMSFSFHFKFHLSFWLKRNVQLKCSHIVSCSNPV